jgi:putative phosphoserine phosphatase/1-acylglycerol-3-phosphate O-acyltransferase
MREIGKPRPTNPGRRLEAEAEAEQRPMLRFASRGTPGIDVLARNLGGLLAAAPIASGAAAVGLWRRSRRSTANLATTLLPDVVLGLAAVSLDVVGTAHLDTARPAVVVCNQRRRVDTLVVARLLRHDCTFVVDRRLAADPVIGTLGRLLDIEFVRAADDLDTRRIARLAERLAQGNSVVFVVGDPERPGTIGPLRSTPFRLAAQTDTPVLPIVVHDSERLVTRRPPVVRPGTMHVSVLAARPVPNLRSADLAARETTGRMQAELDGGRSVRDAVL